MDAHFGLMVMAEAVAQPGLPAGDCSCGMWEVRNMSRGAVEVAMHRY